MSLGLGRGEVKLVPHNLGWAVRYKEEEKTLREILPHDNLVDIEHIGSTSIPGIAAKPIMGILVIVRDLAKASEWRKAFESNGYYFREEESDHLLFGKGPDHGRTVHIHIAKQGSEYVSMALTFRNYLVAHPEVARQYEKLKKNLAAKYPNDRRKYTQSKDKFIKSVLKTAKNNGQET